MVTLSQLQETRYIHRCFQKAPESWWVYRQPLNHKGMASACPRIVYFATSLAAVQQWFTQRKQPVTFMPDEN